MTIAFEKKIRFVAVRASGPGGQRTNRRATKVRARVALADLALSAAEERLIRARLAHRMNARGDIEVTVEDTSSQEMNRDIAAARLRALIAGALRVREVRVPTRVPRRVKYRRLEGKKQLSEKKMRRRAARSSPTP